MPKLIVDKALFAVTSMAVVLFYFTVMWFLPLWAQIALTIFVETPYVLLLLWGIVEWGD